MANRTRPSQRDVRARRFSLNLSTPMIFCAIEAIVLFALIALLNVFVRSEKNERVISMLFTAIAVFYLFSAGVICLVFAVRSSRIRRADRNAMRMETEIYDMFRYIIDLPYAVVDGKGKVKIMNGALQDVLGYKKAAADVPLSDFCSLNVKNLEDSVRNRQLSADETYELPTDRAVSPASVTRLTDGRRYEVLPYTFKSGGIDYYFTVFRDVNDYLELSELVERENSVFAYVVLDNLQELIQYVRADYRAASAEAENIIKAWVESMNGFVREYENDKYLAVFSKKELDVQMQNEFPVQRQIMDMKVGDNSFPLTVSMGISYVGRTFAEKEKYASEALALAIRRGGNQVAVRREDMRGHSFFGGTHKVIEENTAIISRVSEEILEKKIREASGVLIMGHSTPDFDSVGSCVGLARFALSVIEAEYPDTPRSDRPAVNVVIDKSAECYKVCYSQLRTLEYYETVFITKEAARELVTPDTILIICDVNNPGLYESPELADAVSTIGVVDHHRLSGELPFEPFLQYIEATKSSASEMVAEMLMRSKYADELHKEEAEVLLSGIMLDTNNFTRNAGAQTFEMAHYLYSRGAHTGVVREFFNEELDDVLLAGEFESKARIYRDSIAITWLSPDAKSSPNDRVIAAKVADHLLSVKGVKASFALIKIGNDVSISGRSKGEINVQLILERLKGGGHFDLAGAQIRNTVLSTACDMLKDAIDNYFEYDHKQPTDK